MVSVYIFLRQMCYEPSFVDVKLISSFILGELMLLKSNKVVVTRSVGAPHDENRKKGVKVLITFVKIF